MKTLPKERRYETLSYLPPLTDQQIAKQVEFLLDQGFIPGVEFEEDPQPETHFWTMWKLPFFGGATANEVLAEVRECRSENPNCYIRVIGFDNIKQCQTVSFIVHKPNQNQGRY
ncbi:ribulose bisphosphate carboxylase small subunit [Synechocystis sp. PCC 6803]|jgi:ribulose-bisphosphate carboxylase small chain|uniref:Ribulose bisphosphate carboxylase small subunit n=1 Tax=Synechocystis sp. (strain ATCC 27184 / PCC 6803 / Kazusa) TaxID=1111708 RepID=RBS_SYNY3|nr:MULTISPECIES: ribulose bisphosphate carboxylase small subunit [unclassified Synechocystis]P54206.1 RecName: Full=Ribulose bisphosphate carboxylase small subunit; Short=RuBisCO small subunit [Synechocystis sp. PCC 6803 substr. Kazusa]WLT38415.1 ribulose bisphosphate carboxylase small subunit [Synechocystis sp. B12]BAM54464.1 ribulose bisphosphate carboxylase small subunit [Synechocystis sp. PCC 6803] [Bacillus subtilis BEST7613]AGF52485.1 ribulose bisphosphate carboxylase small subunit [Synec